MAEKPESEQSFPGKKHLEGYSDKFHFEETSQADDAVELRYGSEFVGMFSSHGIDPDRLDDVIQDFLNKKGQRAS